jgi:protein O-mannosyl-transferase
MIVCLLLAVATLAFYNPIAHCGFVYSDDVVYVMQNPAIDSGLTWEAVKYAFTSVNTGIWHPLTWLSHALDCQLFKLNPTGHHYVSLLFHTGSAVLLFLLLLEATGATWPSLFVAALFALHPQNVESVAWAAERKNVLSIFLFLLALWQYGRYAKRGGAGRYLGVVSWFALGLLAKPQIITLPCVLLLWDYWPLGRMFGGQQASGSQTGSGSQPTSEAQPGSAEACSPRSFSYLVWEKLPLFALAGASAVLTIWSQRQGRALRSLEEFSFSARMGNAIVGYVRYVAHTFWPIRLSPIYPYTGSPGAAKIAAAAALLAVMTIIVARRRDLRYLAVGWFWFLGTLVPMIGIVQVGDQAMADRYAYIPTIGLFLLLAWGGAEVAQRMRIPKTAVGVAAALLVGTCGVLTYRQLDYWHDGEALWGYAARVSEGNYLAHSELAMVFNGEGRFDDAILEFRAAEALHPFPADQILKIGIYEQRNGHVQGAIEQYRKALSSTSDSHLRSAALSQTGLAYAQMANYDQARQSFESALQVNPRDAGALVASAILAERAGDFHRAVDRLNDAVKAQPSDVGFLLLADALHHAGRVQEAQAATDLAQRISSDMDAAKRNAAQTELFFGYTPQ